MMPEEIMVEVAYALPEEQVIISIKVPTNLTSSRQLKSQVSKKNSPVLIYQKIKSVFLGKKLRSIIFKDRDRIEIYRPLILDPKEMRRKRAAKKKINEMQA
jgi:putative ubiquitin-RnfH superfamily antitoxin RatB of RatAB toxin-antitoxin module